MFYKAKHSNGKIKMNIQARLMLAIVMICVVAFNAMSGLLSYFCDNEHVSNMFTLAESYTVIFDANGGTGTMPNQKIYVGYTTALDSNLYTRDGYTFEGWNTQADGQGTSYADGVDVTNLAAAGSSIRLYAQWEEIKVDVKYAVQIYGINQDEDSSGNPLGLTFGPATGANYNNSYVTHRYEETSQGSGVYNVIIVTHNVASDNTETTTETTLTDSSSNNVTRTAAQVTARQNINLHTMTWAQIEAQASSDPTVFEDCMLCGDTKSVNISLNSTIASGTTATQYGDGAGTLGGVIKSYFKKWNPSSSDNSYVGTGVTLDGDELLDGSNARNSGAYSSSHIRATLIGTNAQTNEAYAGDENLTNGTSLYSCLDSDLQSVITAKKIKYVTGTSESSYTLNDNIADSIWLFSNREMYGNGEYSGTTAEGLGISGDGYNKFGNTESNSYIPTYNEPSNARLAYDETGNMSTWWLRTARLDTTNNAHIVYFGSLGNDHPSVLDKLAFGFCIGTQTVAPKTYEIEFDANGGDGTESGGLGATMPNQVMTIGSSANLNENTYYYDGYYFVEWNTDPNGNGTSYSDKESVTNLSSTENDTVTLYAIWAVETNVAEVVGVGKYSTIAEAMTVAESLTGHQTVRLLKSVAAPGADRQQAVMVNSGKNITLNLRNFTLSNGSLRINIVKNAGTLEIIGGPEGTITSDNVDYGAVDNNAGGNLTIDGIKIIKINGRQAVYNNGGTVEIKGDAYISSDLNTGTTSNDRATVQNAKPQNGTAGTITISGGTIVSLTASTSKATVENANTGTVIITGGTIISKNNIGVDNSGTLTIGVEDGIADDESPIIQGAAYGVKSTSSGTLEFYDGIVKGKTHAFNDENYITDKEDNYDIEHGTEVIDGYNYEIAYLDSATNRLMFYGNGGTPIETVVRVPDDTAIGALLPSAPTREHYSFDGWFTDPENGTQITSSTVITQHESYYAHWTLVEAEVTYNANGGTMDGTNEEDTIVVNVGSSIGSANLPTPTKPYDTFDGWYTDPNPNSGTLIDGTETITQDVTYYAHWTQKVVNVTFNANGGTLDGTNEVDTITINKGTSVGSSNLPIPTKQYKTFAGWYTEQAPNSGTLIDGTETLTQNVTYYAHWTAINVTVTFDPTSGTIPQADASRDLEAGDEVGTLPISATRSGYYFGGWWTDPDPANGVRAKATDIVETTNVTYYAYWILNPVAQIGTIYYETLQKAIRDVPTDNTQTTILLLQDRKEAVEIITDQNIILDLQNHTLRNGGSGGNATLVDPIMQPDKRAVVMENYGTCVITNGTIANSTGQGALNNYADLTLDGVTLTITGTRQGIYNTAGTVLITGNSTLHASSATQRALVQGVSGGTITIDGATLSSDIAASGNKGVIENPASGTVIIKDATITSKNCIGIDNKGTLILGEEDGTAGNTTPVIQGATYGVKTSGNGSAFKFYDGIVKGITNSISGSVADYEDGASKVDSTELIGTDTYNTTCYQ